jgi:hypothetical protein
MTTYFNGAQMPLRGQIGGSPIVSNTGGHTISNFGGYGISNMGAQRQVISTIGVSNPVISQIGAPSIVGNGLVQSTVVPFGATSVQGGIRQSYGINQNQIPIGINPLGYSQQGQFVLKNQNSSFNSVQSRNLCPWWCWLILALLIVLLTSGAIIGLSSLAFKNKNKGNEVNVRT